VIAEQPIHYEESHVTVTPELPAGYLASELADAERLLSYASEVGLDVSDDTRRAIIGARAVNGAPMSQAAATRLLAALTRLSVQVSPVTAESLRALADPAAIRAVLRYYTGVALALAIVCVTCSAATFVSTAISDAIRKDVDTANALALSLANAVSAIDGATNGDGDQRGTPRVSERDVLKDLQQFAISMRAINEHGRQLRWFTGGFAAPPRDVKVADRGEIELRVPLLTLAEVRDEAIAKTRVYQDVRYNAMSAREAASLLTGGLATCLLPVLYAVLGACAYLLRLFEEQIRKRTFVIDTHHARFFIAAIGGLVIGLFNNFNLTQTSTLPPLGLAFLVGYAVDVFFSFLEGLLQAFARHATSRSAVSIPESRI
jgi:hypothetical protein